MDGPGLIGSLDADQFDDVEEIVEGVGAVPELVLLPEAGGHGEEEELVDVRAGSRGVVQSAGCSGVDPPAPKKSERVQESPSMRRRMAVGVSCSRSG